jgi:tetratricopeptide (TPR) repeat protein
MKRLINPAAALLCLTIFLPQISIGTEPAEVIFLIGRGFVIEGNTQRAIEKGMKIPADSVIRLEKKSCVTIRFGGKSYTISPGIAVKLSSILSGAKPDSAVTPLMKIFDKARMVSQTTVLAVRAEQKAQSDIVWAEGDNASREAADDGEAERYSRLSALLNAGDYSGTLRYYSENSTRFGSRTDDAAYAAALSRFYLCRYDESLSLLKPLCDKASDLTLKENAIFYTAFALHSCSEYAESNRYLERFFITGRGNPFAAYAWYIRGLNSGALGDTAGAERCFRTIVENYSSDPIAADAAELIKK